MAGSANINVVVVYSPQARAVREVALTLPAGATARVAVQASDLLLEFPDLLATPLVVGVWGKKVAPGHVLQDQDRVEIYRPLRVDPKVARRERFAKQGTRATGLFANKRKGAKAGY